MRECTSFDLKYAISGGVEHRHCSADARKHVLPKFTRPTAPD